MKRHLFGLSAVALAFSILLVSVFRTASVSRVYPSPKPLETVVLGAKTFDVSYDLPYPGAILPDNILWSFKALRDKIWYSLTFNPLKKAELALLFADKRLQMSRSLFQNKKPDAAVSTLTKGEKYLEMAVSQERAAESRGMDTSSFLVKLTLSSLKHRQIIENDLIPMSTDAAGADMAKVEDYSKNAYKAGRDGLNAKGLVVPESPFSGD